MIKKTDAPAKRSIEVEIDDVPGTPEEVWQAIATGPGFTRWFVPTRIEEREGGAVAFDMAPGMETNGVVTAWEPPRRFVAEEKEWMPGGPPIATEIHVRVARGRHVRRAPREQPLHQQRRLGRPARERGEGLAGVPPHPAPVPHALRRPALRVRDADRPGVPALGGRGLGRPQQGARPVRRDRGTACRGGGAGLPGDRGRRRARGEQPAHDPHRAARLRASSGSRSRTAASARSRWSTSTCTATPARPRGAERAGLARLDGARFPAPATTGADAPTA